MGSTSAMSPRYGEASLVAFRCFGADSGIARAMGRWIFKVLAIIKTSARVFDRRTGCRHPPVDKEGVFVKYSWVGNRRKAECRFEFDKRRQLVIRTRNETFCTVAMCVCNPNHSSIGNQSLRRRPNSNRLLHES